MNPLEITIGFTAAPSTFKEFPNRSPAAISSDTIRASSVQMFPTLAKQVMKGCVSTSSKCMATTSSFLLLAVIKAFVTSNDAQFVGQVQNRRVVQFVDICATRICAINIFSGRTNYQYVALISGTSKVSAFNPSTRLVPLRMRIAWFTQHAPLAWRGTRDADNLSKLIVFDVAFRKYPGLRCSRSQPATP